MTSVCLCFFLCTCLVALRRPCVCTSVCSASAAGIRERLCGLCALHAVFQPFLVGFYDSHTKAAPRGHLERTKGAQRGHQEGIVEARRGHHGGSNGEPRGHKVGTTRAPRGY